MNKKNNNNKISTYIVNKREQNNNDNKKISKIAGTVTFSNFGSTWEIQASNTPVAGGFVAVGTTDGTNFSDVATAKATLAADWNQFGTATDFGGDEAFNLNGYFSGVASGDGGSSTFEGKNIILVAGDGNDIANSNHLLVINQIIY